MKRRLFLQFPLVASALAAQAKNPAGDRGKKGFKIAANKDRYQEELQIMGGKFDCKISSKDTDGDLLVYDTVRETKGGPAMHVHHEQDEWFYVIKGVFMVKVGEETFTLNPGDSAFAPRKIAHAFAKTSEGEAQMLVLFQPAGTMEDFFLQMAKLGKDIPKNQEKELKELWRSHGMEIVGPPLSI
ncbi:cupin domain-containing protein [Sediminibacterium soli]|uniref:cupin domain-containing protein n=1 Tax=Sediminibacterium soli TaxID=2698829 RepID=UPI00137B621A|nr:cupin domain-containing protein [Sediminibacterium soli]NCI45187.1 cupin domain-containing protein [Sediminibacterium soli]